MGEAGSGGAVVVSERREAPSPVVKRIGPFVWWLAGLIFATPIAIAAIGAVCARPIADDYSLMAKVVRWGFAGTFSYYMEHWTAPYSASAFLTGGLALLGKNFIPVASCGLLILILVVAGVVWRTWTSGASSVPTLVAALALSTGMVGSFLSIHWPSSPVLFSALLWSTAWISHVVPILLAPLGLLLAVKGRGLLGVALSLMAGLVIAGFGFAETVTVVSMVVMTGWALQRHGGRGRLREALGSLAGLTAGLVAGEAIIYEMPGTAVRNHVFSTEGIGILQAHGHVVNYFASVAFDDFKAGVLSPAIPLGLILGFVLGALSPRDRFRTYTALIWCAVVTVVAWLAITVGDVYSYQAWWHLDALWIMLYVTAGAAGWWLADIRPSLVGVGAVLAVGCVAWTCVLTTAMTTAAWDRRSIVDGDFARASQIVRTKDATTHLVWVSMWVGGWNGIRDAEPATWPVGDRWVKGNLSFMFGMPERDIVVKIVPSPTATVGYSCQHHLAYYGPCPS